MSSDNQSQSTGRGGKRKGAGRKFGSATKRTREIANKAALEGITPLEFMLKVMRQEVDPNWALQAQVSHQAMRFEAARAAAPYMHPRLASVEHSGPNGEAMKVDAAFGLPESLARALAAIAGAAPARGDAPPVQD